MAHQLIKCGYPTLVFGIVGRAGSHYYARLLRRLYGFQKRDLNVSLKRERNDRSQCVLPFACAVPNGHSRQKLSFTAHRTVMTKQHRLGHAL